MKSKWTSSAAKAAIGATWQNGPFAHKRIISAPSCAAPTPIFHSNYGAVSSNRHRSLSIYCTAQESTHDYQPKPSFMAPSISKGHPLDRQEQEFSSMNYPTSVVHGLLMQYLDSPASEHCRCYKVWVFETGSERIASTLRWFPTQVPLLRTSSTDTTTAAAHNLIFALECLP